MISEAWRGEAWPGLARQGTGYTKLIMARYNISESGHGQARQGTARQDKARATLHKEATMPVLTRQFSFSLNVDKDADVIEYLDYQENRTEAIRQAIRDQMVEDDAR